MVQDAYLRAWRGIGKFRGEAQFSTWMYRITANAAATHVASAAGASRPSRSTTIVEPADTAHRARSPPRWRSRPSRSSGSRAALDELPAEAAHASSC